MSPGLIRRILGTVGVKIGQFAFKVFAESHLVRVRSLAKARLGRYKKNEDASEDNSEEMSSVHLY